MTDKNDAPPGAALPPLALVMRAALFAAEHHVDQRRKGARQAPYINHPIDVAERLVRIARVTDEATLAAALLHDTIEDTSATGADLTQHFGAAIAAIVAEVSDDDSLPSRARKALQIERAPQLSPPAKLIRLSDKISNVREMEINPPHWPVERKRRYVAWARKVVAALGPVNPALEHRFEDVAAATEKALDALEADETQAGAATPDTLTRAKALASTPPRQA
ncbi:MAG: HD domain-containing protein [Pseudomonadota bacterium]